MAEQSVTVPLFATPFATVDTGAHPEFNERLARLCEAQLASPAPPDDAARDPLHFQGRDDLLASEHDAAVELRRNLLGSASRVIAGLSALGSAEFAALRIQAQGWCSIVQRNGHIAARHFPGAAWLAVYCVQAGEPDGGSKSAGVLRLYERRLGSMYRDASTRDLASPWRFGNHSWSPLPGWMALFPAYVPHEISVVRSDAPLILVFAKLRFLDAGATDDVNG